jgi:hypothetical protein
MSAGGQGAMSGARARPVRKRHREWCTLVAGSRSWPIMPSLVDLDPTRE